jgi:recombination protein RecA
LFCYRQICNQLRQKIGVMFGSPETTTGGQALKFYCSVRLDIRKIGQVKQGEEAIGNRVRVRVVKNKCAPPFKQAEFDLTFGLGVNKVGEIVDLAADAGLLEKSGAWYGYKGERIAQGRERACSFMQERPDVAEEIRLTLLEAAKAELLAGPAPGGGGNGAGISVPVPVPAAVAAA